MRHDLRSLTVPLIAMLQCRRDEAHAMALAAGRLGLPETEAAYFSRSVDLKHVIEVVRREVEWECAIHQELRQEV